nr:S-methylmethionine--homocysteine S-methyltransferase BHMT2 [Kogia breviceps]
MGGILAPCAARHSAPATAAARGHWPEAPGPRRHLDGSEPRFTRSRIAYTTGILERLDSGEVVGGDGSILITLEKRGYMKAGLWTSEAIVEHSNAVRQLHMEFLRAGSNVMQTFTFSASEDKMESQGNDNGAAVNTAACDLAREVANKGDALVAGGICQTTLYKHHQDEARIKKLFRLQLEVFVRKNVDFLIAEAKNWLEDFSSFL